MRQAEVIVAMGKSELLAQPLLAFAQRGDSPPHGRHMLANRQVDAFDKGGYYHRRESKPISPLKK